RGRFRTAASGRPRLDTGAEPSHAPVPERGSARKHSQCAARHRKRLEEPPCPKLTVTAPLHGWKPYCPSVSEARFRYRNMVLGADFHCAAAQKPSVFFRTRRRSLAMTLTCLSRTGTALRRDGTCPGFFPCPPPAQAGFPTH